MIKREKKGKPFSLYILLALLFFQGISGLIGGLALTVNPSGNLIQMPISLLEGSPFDNFLIPGLVLLLLLGIYPSLIFYALLTKVECRFLSALNIYKDRFWGWTGSLYLAIILILWIDFEILFIGYYYFFYLQTIYALLGVLILIFTLLPSIQNYYLENKT
jgi:hypothetical protein